ncbi:MAG: sugar phosphate isomerase/epimerase family protein [Planctomycetota bacterium]
MRLSICSFSYHRAFFAGRCDLAQYIDHSRRHGATHLNIWIPHLLHDPDPAALQAWQWHPGSPEIPDFLQAPTDAGWCTQVRDLIAAGGMPVEMLAMEKAFVHLRDPDHLRRHHDFLRGWLRFCERTGIGAMRIDPGGHRSDWDETDVDAAVAGYRHWCAVAADHGVTLYVENHWGMCQRPAVLERLLEGAPALRYLFDSSNWPDDAIRMQGLERVGPRASATHLKCRELDADLVEHAYDMAGIIRRLAQWDVDRIWGIEAMPADGDEDGAVGRTRRLIERCLAEVAA